MHTFFNFQVFGQAASGSSVTIEISNSGDKTNPFGVTVNTTDKGNASVTIFGSTGNSGHTPFPVNTNGNASASNQFAVNMTGKNLVSLYDARLPTAGNSSLCTVWSSSDVGCSCVNE